MQAETAIETVRTELEKVMLGISNKRTSDEHRMFLAGYIESLFIKGHILGDMRDTLYAEYCF